MKRRPIAFMLSALTLMMAGCSLFDFPMQPEPLDDQRFQGSFTYASYGYDEYGLPDEEVVRYRFDGTSKAYYYHQYEWWGTTSGWHYSGDYPGDAYEFDFEFEVSDGMYRHRLWDNEFSDWTEWEPYEFSDDGKTLTLHNHNNLDFVDYILTKSE